MNKENEATIVPMDDCGVANEDSNHDDQPESLSSSTTTASSGSNSSDHEDQDSSESSSRSMHSSSNKCPFDADISTKISTAFAKTTGIDIELAVQLLDEHGWNIDQALNAAYEANDLPQPTTTTDALNWKTSNATQFKIMSWNTDTDDSDDAESNHLIEQRTEAMIDVILREKPDVILLQQVGTFALTLIITCLSTLYDDESVQIAPPRNCNYVSIFIRKSILQKKTLSVHRLSNTWQMLQVEVVYNKSINLDLFTALIDDDSQSESIAAFCFEQIDKNNPDHIVLFGASNKTADDLWHSRPSNLTDLWEVTNKQAECVHTFDSQCNSNITGNETQARDDRLLFRPSASMSLHFKPISVEHESIEHINFPSSYWPIQCSFDVNVC